MHIVVNDVDHGACIMITGPQGHRLMIDCGQSLTRPWFPSISYDGLTIDTLMLSNLDEDHVADLPSVLQSTFVNAIVSNPTVSAQLLDAMKSKGMRKGVACAHDVLARFGDGFIGDWEHHLGGVHWHIFWNRCVADFVDTNNLSLAVFVTYGGLTVLYGGDMERPGWERLLRIPDFRQRLRDVKVYIASHHGRENGKCNSLFEVMRPEIIIISDGRITHGTQETTDWYSRRATGILDLRTSTVFEPLKYRRVLTTRQDGTIAIQVHSNGRYTVNLSKPELVPEGIASLFAPQTSPFGSSRY